MSFDSSFYLNGCGCYSSASFLQVVEPGTDSVLCSTPADLNMDGRCEMMLGTYSAQMVVFQETNDGARDTHDDDTTQRASRIDAPNGYQLATNKQFAHPIYVSHRRSSPRPSARVFCEVRMLLGCFSHCYVAVLVCVRAVQSLMSVDVSGSGVCDLIVTSLFSVDVLSWEVESAMQLMHNKMHCMDEIRMLEQAMEDMHKQQQAQQQPSSSASPIRAN